MLAAIKDDKVIKFLPDNWSGNFPDAEIVWLPKSYFRLASVYMDTGVYPDDPRLTMDQAELDMVNTVNADRIQRALDIQTNLPSWADVETYLNNLANLAEAKNALKKIARVVYWLAKNTSN